MIGIVYKVEVNKDDFYIGSTIKKLKERQSLHNNTLKQNVITNKLYEKCRENNITNIICILLEQKEVENKEEIRQLEQEYIKELQPTLNSQSAYTGLIGLTKEVYQKEYREHNKEHNNKYSEEWRDNNKEYMKEWYDNNKKYMKEHNKKYYENNKEKILSTKKQYYEDNKEEINKKHKEKINCPICNSIVSRTYIAIHKKTKKCLYGRKN